MTKTAIACVAALVFGLPAVSGHASIEGSKHDFRSRGADSRPAGRSTEICAFCHTPTGSRSESDAPLWNPQVHNGDNAVTFARTPSFGTADLDENAVGPVSVTCLACHDGSQAPDARYVERIPPRVITPGTPPGQATTGGEVSFSGPIADILFTPMEGAFFSEHPVYVPYAGGACAGIESDCDPAHALRGSHDFSVVRFQEINSMKNWWIDAAQGVDGMREKSDVILYARNFDGVVGPAVECGSCHDPHDGRERPVSFLRLPAAEGSLCLTCHIK